MGAYRQPEIKKKENIEWGSSEYFSIFLALAKNYYR